MDSPGSACATREASLARAIPLRFPPQGFACICFGDIVHYITHMDREWNDTQPIYRQIRDRAAAMLRKEGAKTLGGRDIGAARVL